VDTVNNKEQTMEDYEDFAYDELERDHDEAYEPDCDDSDDGEALASAGFGTDEDYGYYGDE